MTYKSRLLLYVGMLAVLLVGMMTLSFRAARDLILQSGYEQLRHGALRKEDSLRAQREELLHYADIVSSDQRLQEYLLTRIGMDKKVDGLAAYDDRQLAALPLDYYAVLSADGELLLGSGFQPLIKEAQSQLVPGRRDHIYFVAAEGVVSVAQAPVSYRDQELAMVFVATVMDEGWLNSQERRSRDYLLFFEQNTKMLWSSNPLYRDLTIDGQGHTLTGRGEYFRLREVSLYGGGHDLPRLWFGISETRLTQLLDSYERWVYLFAAMGGLVVLLLGVLMLRNFKRPLTQLMLTTEQMINGELPVISRSQSNTEMDRLVNRFADVLDALRHEQHEVKCAHRKLQETAITDSLTGLYNRRYLQELAPGLFAQVERDQRYLTSILLDLDHFKRINDCYGHLGGDAVLVHFSRLLKHNSRINDHLFRIGGEEFLILNVAENPEDSVLLANKVRELVDHAPASYQGVEIPITVSIGISCYIGKHGEGSLSSLMRGADKALYEAKEGGRNRVVLHSSCLSAVAPATPGDKITLIKND